jgi:hypothetical protein
MLPARATVLLFTLVSLSQAVAADLDKAAALAGMTAGMAASCNFDAKPVLLEAQALFDRAGVSYAERERLKRIVVLSGSIGLQGQQAGAISCSQVQSRMTEALDTLRNAK